MSPRRPPDEPKDRAPDEILLAPPEDRDPPEDRPGQKSADPKDDPSSSKSTKKARLRKRFRLAQDPGGPVEAPGASPPLDDEAPMNALSPAKAKTAKPKTTKLTLPQRVTKPEVQRHHNLSATVVRGPKVEHGEVRWYWRIDRCANAALGVTERETVFHKWLTVTEAQSELADLVIRGAHRAQMVFSGRRIVTFADLIKADEEAQGEPAHLCAATHVRRAERRRWLTKLLGHKAILQTSKDELERMFLGTITAGRAHLSVKKEAEFLLRAWRWAFDERIVAVKPPPKLELGSVNTEPPATPTRAQVNAIIQALDGEQRLIVQVLASTGARIGEVVSLRRCDYDTHTHWLTVNGKTGPRRIPIDETLRDVLAARADGTTSSLFNWGSKSARAVEQGDWIRRAIERACRRLNLPSFTPHSFRRAAVNFFIDHGFDPKVVAVLLGHSVNVAMEYYRTPTPEQIERMVMAARPGEFSETSSVLRAALDTLSSLLKVEALMADDHARDAVTVLLSSLGKAIGHKKEPSAGPAEQDKATTQAVQGASPPAQPRAVSASAPEPRAPSAGAPRQRRNTQTPASEPREPRAVAPAQRGNSQTSAPAQPPARAAAPVAPAAARAGAPLSSKVSPSPVPAPRPATLRTAPARAQRDGAAPPARQITTPSRMLPASAQPHPSGELAARHEPRHGPPRALADKLAKG